MKTSEFIVFSVQREAQCLSRYHETGPITERLGKYRSKYNESSLVRNKILQWVQNFWDKRSEEDRVWSGSPESSSMREQRVATKFYRNRRRSPRTAERNITIPRSSIRRLLWDRVHMFPYIIQIVQQLEDRDYAGWTWFVNRCWQNTESGCSFLDRIIFSDEYAFHLDWNVNKHNVIIWGTEVLHQYQQKLRDGETYAYGQQCQ